LIGFQLTQAGFPKARKKTSFAALRVQAPQHKVKTT